MCIVQGARAQRPWTFSVKSEQHLWSVAKVQPLNITIDGLDFEFYHQNLFTQIQFIDFQNILMHKLSQA